MEKIEGIKFFNFSSKNVFYSETEHAESESENEKILKNFPEKLWSKNQLSPRLLEI